MRVMTGPLECEAEPRVLAGRAPEPRGPIVYEEPSDSDASRKYKVFYYSDGTMTCDCDDFTHRGNQRPCKHINRRRRKLGLT